MSTADAAAHLLNAGARVRAYVLAFAEEDDTLSVFTAGTAIEKSGLVAVLASVVDDHVLEVVRELGVDEDEDDDDATRRPS